MKIYRLAAAGVVLCACLAEASVRVVRDTEGYVPPLVANGELAMTVDRTFAVRDSRNGGLCEGIFLAGRRVSHPRRELLPQGGWHKVLEVNGREAELPDWEQRLDVADGTVTCVLRGKDLEFVGETFVPLSENTVAIRETVISRAAKPLQVTLGVRYEPGAHERIVGKFSADGLVWRFRSYGYNVIDGVTTLSAADETFTLAPGARRTIERFIVFSDSLRGNPSGPRGYEALKAANARAWADFRGESAVELPEEGLQRMWEMANYHLRINATPWSFPVGLLNSHWQGLYFGFDAMYMQQGLVSSGHFAVSRREPDFRFATLQRAIDRTAYGDRYRDYGARWHWEALEDGASEGTVPGEWQDHIFHMAAIAKCAWQQWLYGRDRAWFAARGYPVLFEAARYFRRNWVYADSNGDTYIGKCCDLERLGPSRDHPFMTTVGAVYALRAAAEASNLLGTNAVAAADFRECADRLVRSLPVKDGRYIACLNDPQESVATLAGFFPFPVFGPDHAPQRAAVRHFFDAGRVSGNMYPTGTNVCPWYAGTMSAAASWMGDRVEAVRWLREAADAAGRFGEFFEINEPGVVHHPWFATAAGNCLFALNQMLLCDCEGKVRIGFTVPAEWRDYAFRLPSQRGVTVDVAVRDGRLAHFAVMCRADSETPVFVMRPEILAGVDLKAFGLRPISRAADRIELVWSPIPLDAPMDITKDWLVQPVAVPKGWTLEKEIPYAEGADKWTKGDFAGSIPLPPGVKPAEPWTTPYNAWYRKEVFIPADWKDLSVRLERFLWWCDLSVFVNGRKAGVMYHPDGAVELAPLLAFGATNRIEIFATNGGFGTGEGPVTYRGRGDQQTAVRHFDGFARTPNPALLVPRSAVHMEDYQLLCSWRKKTLTVRLEIESTVEGRVEAEIELSDDAGRDGRNALRVGKVVKTAKESFAVKPGRNVVDVVIPWADVKPWEAVENPKLYNAFVRLTHAGRPCVTPEKKVFGFREVWHEGRRILMNGHEQHFRGAWGVRGWIGTRAPHAYGHNLIYQTHNHAPVLKEDFEPYARAGIAIFTATPTIYYVHDDIRKDKWCSIQFSRHLDFWLKSVRNAPSVIAASVGVNQICPERNMRPEMLGIVPEGSAVVKNIEYACDMARSRNPGVLYFSHADGTEADLSSSNLYLNWTPLQEREEWLSDWSKKGILPWYAAEFASPYMGCWFHVGCPQVSEWLAIFYGEEAYEKETDDLVRLSGPLARAAMSRPHGVTVEGKGPYELHPLAEELSRKLVYRTNRSWRAYGLNGGLMYLLGWNWTADEDRIRERHALAAGQICAFLGGHGNHADRTQAYREGEPIEKDVVLIWDGVGDNAFRVRWQLTDDDTKARVKEGFLTASLKPGEQCKIPLVVTPPAIAKGRGRGNWRLEITVDARDMNEDYPANLTCKRDCVELHTYPKGLPNFRRPSESELGLYDPEGDTANLLDAMEVKYTRCTALTNALANMRLRTLVIGRHALVHAEGLEAFVPRIAEKGLRLLVMPQTAETMEMLGFRVEDTMSRELHNVSIAGIDDVDLSYWGGEPLADAPTGPVMAHKTRRGPRWTHRHAIASMPILLPARAGWTALVRGEFDMSYAGVLRARAGKGDVTFVALDFEGRCGEKGCPAATRVFAKLLEDVCRHGLSPSRAFYTDGAAAERLAGRLGVDFAPLPKTGTVDGAFVLVGKDSKLTAKALAERLGGNSAYAVVANDEFAASAGFGLVRETTPAYRFAPKLGRHSSAVFAGMSRAWFRDRAGTPAAKLVASDVSKPWKLEPCGFFASTRGGYLDMIDPFAGADAYRPAGGKVAGNNRWGGANDERDVLFRNAVQSEENHLRRWAHFLASQGVAASTNFLARALYTKPKTAYDTIAEYNYLGPWPCNYDDSEYLVDTADFPVDPKAGGDTGAEAERMAIAGDTQPNPRFHPLGLEYPADRKLEDRYLDWRPTVRPKPDGMVDLREIPFLASQSFQTTYLVGYLERERAGNVTVRFGIDWRGKVWVNGQEIIKTYAGGKDPGSIVAENVPLKAGRNVFTVKAGSGQAGCFFYLDFTKEVKSTDVRRRSIETLDSIDLYETDNPLFDPYTYVYW